MSKHITVLKFGGSVLRDERDLSKAVSEIYRHWRNGTKVLAVVSAFNGRTDALLAKAERFESGNGGVPLASLLLSGETESAALLALAIERSGLPAKILTPRQIGLLTRGETLDAEPIWADTERLKNELKASIVVISGFGGIDRNGDPTLLGRGGSDLTALFLAERLDARCILLKDVAGLYESDPAVSTDSRLFAKASYRTAAEIGGRLIQRKAVEYAEAHSLTVELRALNAETGTIVSDIPSSFAKGKMNSKPLRIALFGCGTVGRGVFEAIFDHPDKFEVDGVLNQHREKAIAAGVPEYLIENNADVLLAKHADVVIELIGGTDVAHKIVKHSLSNGRHVITANKALLAEAVNELTEVAESRGVTLSYSASVGGAMPALEFAGKYSGDIRAISGILNGTCNFVCDELVNGIDLDQAIRSAQASGFAESDPTLDLDGTDSAQKLILLAREVFGVDIPFSDVKRKGIEGITAKDVRSAAARSRTIRLVARVERVGDIYEASVEPQEVWIESPFGNNRGADNCLMIEDREGNRRFISASGAGRYPTTEAVMADLFDLHREHSTQAKNLVGTAEAGI